jgi:heme exporter protein D
MHWASWSEFWNMGGYGYYVWMSFGAALAGVVIEIVLLRHRRGLAVKQIEAERDLEATD